VIWKNNDLLSEYLQKRTANLFFLLLFGKIIVILRFGKKVKSVWKRK